MSAPQLTVNTSPTVGAFNRVITTGKNADQRPPASGFSPVSRALRKRPVTVTLGPRTARHRMQFNKPDVFESSDDDGGASVSVCLGPAHVDTFAARFTRDSPCLQPLLSPGSSRYVMSPAARSPQRAKTQTHASTVRAREQLSATVGGHQQPAAGHGAIFSSRYNNKREGDGGAAAPGTQGLPRIGSAVKQDKRENRRRRRRRRKERAARVKRWVGLEAC